MITTRIVPLVLLLICFCSSVVEAAPPGPKKFKFTKSKPEVFEVAEVLVYENGSLRRYLSQVVLAERVLQTKQNFDEFYPVPGKPGKRKSGLFLPGLRDRFKPRLFAVPYHIMTDVAFLRWSGGYDYFIRIAYDSGVGSEHITVWLPEADATRFINGLKEVSERSPTEEMAESIEAFVRGEPSDSPVTREDFISSHFGGRSLSPIEGMWVRSDNQYEIGIFRDTLGIHKGYLFEAKAISSGRAGRTKFRLRETAASHLYPCIAYLDDGSTFGTTIILKNENLASVLIPDRERDVPVERILIRTYPLSPEDGKSQEQTQGHGTGFFVTQNVVATNYHVVRGAQSISIVTDATMSFDAKVLVRDKANDIALLRVTPNPSAPSSGQRVMPLGDSNETKVGQKVFTIGYPLSPELVGSRSKVSEGIINSVTGINDNPTHFQISIPIHPGNSGGPLIDEYGRVVGIVTLTANPRVFLAESGILPQNVGWAVKGSYLVNLISLLPDDVELQESTQSVKLDAQLVAEEYASSVVRVDVVTSR